VVERSKGDRPSAAEAAMTSAATQDVVDILTTDHHEVLDLVQQIKDPGTAPEQKREMTHTVIAELVRHSVAEEMYVYPVMKKEMPNGAEAVEHDTAEHKQLEREMATLEDLSPDADGFAEAIGRLEDILRDHVSDEENEHFPELRKNVSQEQLVKMGEQVENAKKIAPTRPHPNAPNNELFHKVAGVGVGMIDRLRDRLAGQKP
jgi:hemerythrin-like domain-containing protein